MAMPELPEVETVRRGLQQLLPGKAVSALTYDWPKGFPNSPRDIKAFVYGAQIKAVRRRAKVLFIDLDSGYSLIVHLKMTGQLVYMHQQSPGGDGARFGAGHPNKSLIGALPDASTRVTISFTDGSKLYFNDQRKFGWMKLYPTDEIPLLDFFKRVGPEPLLDDFSVTIFNQRLQRRKKTAIKAALLDQTVLAGVGNIYADESLWGARLHPATRVEHIASHQVSTLHKEIRQILLQAIEAGGSTDKNYVDAEGRQGSYLQIARVFRKEGQPCPRCSAEITKIRVAGRGTHICSRCQKVST